MYAYKNPDLALKNISQTTSRYVLTEEESQLCLALIATLTSCNSVDEFSEAVSAATEALTLLSEKIFEFIDQNEEFITQAAPEIIRMLRLYLDQVNMHQEVKLSILALLGTLAPKSYVTPNTKIE